MAKKEVTHNNLVGGRIAAPSRKRKQVAKASKVRKASATKRGTRGVARSTR